MKFRLIDIPSGIRLKIGLIAATGLALSLAAPAFSQSTKQFSVYGGTARINGGADTMELGGPGTWPIPPQPAGPYLLSSGSIFLRPNQSAAGSRFEGAVGQASQRLVLTGGLDGRSTLDVTINPRTEIGGDQYGLQATFDGLAYVSAGSAVYGEVTSCGAGKNCSAGYFSESVESQNRSTPTVLAVGTGLGNGAAVSARNKGGGLAALFENTIVITGNIFADNNEVESCADWQTVNPGDTVCGIGQYVAGWKMDSVGGTNKRVTQIHCCNL